MKITCIIFGALITLSCTNSTPTKGLEGKDTQQDTVKPSVEAKSSDDGQWTDNFLEFRKAITTGNSVAVKDFMDFPINNEGNEIWFLVDPELVMEMESDNIKPFTEANFDKYFSSIFGLDFRKTLEQLNVEEFFNTNYSTSPEMEIVKGSKSKLEASFEKSTRKLTLTLLTIGEEFSEFTVIYQFEITSEHKLKFRQVRVAG